MPAPVNVTAILWFIAAILLFVIEGSTYALVCIWFAGGALVALVLSLFGAHPVVQLLAFVIVSAALLVSLRPVAQRVVKKRKVNTNSDRVIGQEGVVITQIEPISGQGQVRVMGQVWSAKPEDNASVIERDRRVSVVGISGVKVIVREKAQW